MAWDSFTEITAIIIGALQGDAELKDFCRSNYQKPLTVRKGVKRREEIALTELPLVMVTTPFQQSVYEGAQMIGRTYTLRAYCGFQQGDRERAIDELLRFEELLAQSLLSVDMSNDAILVTPGDSAYDEGFSHPYYFFLKEFRVMVEREP